MGRVLCRIAHTLRWGRIYAKLRWVPLKLNPAHHPSIIFEFPSPTLMHDTFLRRPSKRPLTCCLWAGLALLGRVALVVMWPWLADPK